MDPNFFRSLFPGDLPAAPELSVLSRPVLSLSFTRGWVELSSCKSLLVVSIGVSTSLAATSSPPPIYSASGVYSFSRGSLGEGTFTISENLSGGSKFLSLDKRGRDKELIVGLVAIPPVCSDAVVAVTSKL